MPVTYVYYTVAVGKDDVHDHSPSTAIVVVRKFLDEKLRDHPVVLFQMLGPSPCHVDVFIGEASVEASDDVTDLSLIGGGYRTFYFGSPEKLPESHLSVAIAGLQCIDQSFSDRDLSQAQADSLQKI